MNPIDEILSRIQQAMVQKGTMKKVLAEYIGYNGAISTKGTAMTKLLKKELELLVRHLNKIAEFYRYPVGYFLFGDEKSLCEQIDEEAIVEWLCRFFEEEQKKPKKQRRAKYKLGALMGYGEDKTAQLNTANDIILRKKRKLRISDLFAIAQFFEIPLEKVVHLGAKEEVE